MKYLIRDLPDLRFLCSNLSPAVSPSPYSLFYPLTLDLALLLDLPASLNLQQTDSNFLGRRLPTRTLSSSRAFLPLQDEIDHAVLASEFP
jgi:hypothetical protein